MSHRGSRPSPLDRRATMNPGHHHRTPRLLPLLLLLLVVLLPSLLCGAQRTPRPRTGPAKKAQQQQQKQQQQKQQQKQQQEQQQKQQQQAEEEEEDVGAGPLLYFGPQFYSDCPRECFCSPDFSTALNCESRRLSAVPGLPNRTQHLYLQHNRISAVPLEPFQNASELRWLNLNRNKIANNKVAKNVFSKMKNLLHLYMEHNDLKELPFPLPSSLQQLKLAHNRIARLPGAAFNKLPNLLLLDLSSNQIEDGALSGEIFRGLKGLIQLNLYKNKITKMPPQLPRGLYQLFLERNSIAEIPESYFDKLDHIFSIRLTFNKLTDSGLPRSIFNISTLLELSLGHNGLTRVPLFTPRLEHLHLDHNHIKAWNVSEVCDVRNPIPAAGPARLRYLRLDDNELRALSTTEIIICFPLLHAFMI
ncbi:unnamed protein product [Lampetra fluviatilis]